MSIVDKHIQNQLIQAMKALSEKPKGYDTTATVVRVDKKIAYVHIDNGADETPASMSVNAAPGDIVVIHIENGQARITGNSTSPPTDDRVANTAIQSSSEARVIAEDAHLESTTAMREADKAIGYADLAQDNANKALDSAQKALASADDAKVAADVAKENASKAISSADDAASAASDAQSKAEDATKSANNAGKAASAAQAAAEAAQGDIDEQKNYFWKDNEGAHILSEEEGKKINVTSDGIEVVSAKDSNTLMNVSSSKGVYFDENIPVTIGNDNANIKYYDSDNDGKADAISITASSIIFASSGENVETSINEAKDTANNSVKSLVTEYASNQSSVIAPTEGEGWSSASPERKDGYFIWQRTVTKTSNDTTYSDPVCITGADGKGVKGTEVTYQAGSSGTTAPTGTWGSSVPTVPNGQYLWTKKVTTYTDNTTSTEYSVGYKGTNGINGADAITVVVTSSNGLIFKNSDIATTLTAHVYRGGTEITGTALSGLGSIKWYKDGGSTAVATGTTFSISAGDIDNKASYVAQLEG